jgi:hypothetical protein
MLRAVGLPLQGAVGSGATVSEGGTLGYDGAGLRPMGFYDGAGPSASGFCDGEGLSA